MSVVSIPAAFCEWPTAVHIWLAPQDTPLRKFGAGPGRLGVDRRLHAVPSQTSASVWKFPKPAVEESPTAVQASAAVHDTLFRVLTWNAEGWGVGCRLHVDPFHTSARVCELP